MTAGHFVESEENLVVFSNFYINVHTSMFAIFVSQFKNLCVYTQSLVSGYLGYFFFHKELRGLVDGKTKFKYLNTYFMLSNR